MDETKRERRNKYIFIGVIIAIVLIVTAFSARAETCYQSIPNVSSSCGGLDTGYIVATDDSYAPDVNSIRFNYSKPIGAFNATWQVEHGWNDSLNRPNLYNVSIPDSCWNADANSLSVKLTSNYVYCYAGNDSCDSMNSLSSCYNGTDWETLFANPTLITYCRGFPAADAFYENVYDGLWFADDNESYAYFCHTFPSRHWMNGAEYTYPWYNCLRPAMLFEQGMYWDICTENWTAHNTSCTSRQLTTYYIDENNCGTTLNMPANSTHSCGSSGGGGGGYWPSDAVGEGTNNNNVTTGAPMLSVSGGEKFDLWAWLKALWQKWFGGQ